MKSVWTKGGVFYQSPPDLLGLGDRGFIFGHRVMTTILVLKNKFIDLDRHIDRLHQSALDCGLDHDFRKEVIQFELNGLLEAYPQDKAACRIYITAGSGRLMDPVQVPNRWIHIEAIPEAPLAPLKLQIMTDLQWRRGSRVKTGLYSEQIFQVSKAKTSGFDDILWCNGDQEICETTTANVFLLGRDGDLVEIATPPESSGILLGVTRRRIMELLSDAKIPVTERIIYRDEIPRFDEGFTSSSLGGLRPIAQIGQHKLHSARHQSVFTHISRLWETWRSL